MRVGSLFTGIGGFDLAFERAGFEIAWQCEIDKHAGAVLERRWPTVLRFEDVRWIDGKLADAVDVLVGGFPCQDLSVAGRRAGLAGERSGLFFEFARCIEEFAPEWVVIENVPGLLSSNGGRDMAAVVGTLGELGYGWAYRVLDAQYFGLAQRRKRVFIVGCSGGRTRRAAEILFEPESVCRDSPPRREAREGIAGTLGGSSQSGGFRTTDLDNNGAYVIQERAVAENLTSGPQGKGWQFEQSFTLEARHHSQIVASPISPTLRAKYGKQAFRGDGADPIVFEARFARNGRGAADTIAPPLKAENGGTGKGDGAPLVTYVPPVVPNAISAKWAKGAGGPAGDEILNLVARYVPEVSPTLLSGANQTGGTRPPGSTVDNCESLLGVYGLVRRLTPKECERLQGFPDDWTAGQADSSRYRQLGNAVAVPVGEWIARRVMEASSSTVERPAVNGGVAGSNPASPARRVRA